MKHEDFFTLATSETKVFKVTMETNTRNLKGILAFFLQIFMVLVYWTMSFHRRHATIHFDDFLIYLLPLKPRFSRSLLQTQGTSRVFQHFSYRYFWFCFIGQCHSFADMVQYIFTTSSYLLFLKPRLSRSFLHFYFKQKEPQGYSCIYLTDIFGFGLLDNVIPS